MRTVWLTLGITALSLTVACGGPSSALVVVEPLDPGEECPAGGISVHSGTDTDGDGVLAPSEYERTQVVCNGADGASGTDGEDGADGTDGEAGEDGNDGADGTNSLIVTTELPEGDPACPWGGLRVDIGHDDGSGDGIPGDGTLQQGELEHSEVLCHDAPEGAIAWPEEPAGAGQYLVDLSGSDGGSDAYGGAGGSLLVVAPQGTGGGDMTFFATGEADASFDMPPLPVPDLGWHPFVIDQDTDLPATDPQDGDLVWCPDTETAIAIGPIGPSGSVCEVDGDEAVPVTGLEIRSGATLTVIPDVLEGGLDIPTIELPDGLYNAGTLQVDATASEEYDLRLELGTYVGAPGSLLDFSEARSLVTIETRPSQDAAGAFANAGTIDASSALGAGGQVQVASYARIHNSGDIFVGGGPGEAGGNIFLSALSGAVTNAGSLDARGGDGEYAGGDGGMIWVNTAFGEVRNTGDLSVDGGAVSAVCTMDCLTGIGPGAGGEIALLARGGSVYSAATLSADSGSMPAPGVAGLAMSEAGGGTIAITVEESGGYPPGDLHVSGDLTARGTSSALNGGVGGGSVTLTVDQPWDAPPSWITLYGYTAFDLTGGDGLEGGSGGTFQASHDPMDSESPGASGGIVNYVPIRTTGGTGAEYAGGSGGEIALVTSLDATGARRGVVRSAAFLDSRGGAGGGPGAPEGSGGDGGAVHLVGVNGLDNRGGIDTRGGASADDSAGWPGQVDLEAPWGPLRNEGSVTADGADGDISASRGGRIELQGWRVDNAADLSAHGGSAPTGEGGSGGTVVFRSTHGASTHSGAIDIAPGTSGDGPASAGQVFIDDVDLTADFAP